MTWSIVAFDKASGTFAAAVTTRAFAVGSRAPFVRAGVGAVCTQSISNWYLAPKILDLIERDIEPAAAIEVALRADEGRHLRQVHAVDRHGRTAAWTGRNCVEWAGHRPGEGYGVAGNMLTGAAVVDMTFEAFHQGARLPLPERLLAALDAGQQAGGDRRGRQSAAMLLATTEDYPDVDIRVDDHAEPLVEMRRLLGVYRRDVAPQRPIRPTRANPSGETDLELMEADWKSKGVDLRFRR
ncbi:MAG: DUF1028 domain-containing protein [Alphaproteobacteria bacterium]|nr:DUF1028 domain-containing protein [Alphaproteobacteria bacterium]